MIPGSEDITGGVPSVGNETKTLAEKIREYFHENIWVRWLNALIADSVVRPLLMTFMFLLLPGN